MLVRLVGILMLRIAAVRAAHAIAEHRRSREEKGKFDWQRAISAEDEATADMTFEREHVNPAWNCWCHADLVMEPGNGIDDDFLGLWIHKGLGDEPASAQEIAEAIRNAIIGNADG